MSAMDFCEDLHTSGGTIMPARARYVPGTAGGGEARRMLSGAWEREPDACAALGPAGQVWHQAFSFRPDPARPRTYLVFQGVGQGFHVRLNGKYLGCSQHACGWAEFDVSAAVRQGGNTLAVLLMGCGQGIGAFREVYLLQRPGDHIWDCTISTEIRERAVVSVQTSFAGRRQPVTARLLDMEGGLVEEKTSSTDGQRMELTITEPRLWDPEAPYRYTLLLESAGEQIRTSVALHRVSVDGDRILLNGTPLKLCAAGETRLTLKKTM